MTEKRDELIHLIEDLPEDQVDVLLADVRRLGSVRSKGTWPPKFVGMIKNGPVDGSTPEHIGSLLAGGFGRDSQ